MGRPACRWPPRCHVAGGGIRRHIRHPVPPHRCAGEHVTHRFAGFARLDAAEQRHAHHYGGGVACRRDRHRWSPTGHHGARDPVRQRHRLPGRRHDMELPARTQRLFLGNVQLYGERWLGPGDLDGEPRPRGRPSPSDEPVRFLGFRRDVGQHGSGSGRRAYRNARVRPGACRRRYRQRAAFRRLAVCERPGFPRVELGQWRLHTQHVGQLRRGAGRNGGAPGRHPDRPGRWRRHQSEVVPVRLCRESWLPLPQHRRRRPIHQRTVQSRGRAVVRRGLRPLWRDLPVLRQWQPRRHGPGKLCPAGSRCTAL